MSAFIGEIFMTFLLCYTVWETAVTARCGQAACIPIGPLSSAPSANAHRTAVLITPALSA
jgi:glycerol uptake facilitator-like aquaporin